MYKGYLGAKQEMKEQIEQVFDQFRSSNQKLEDGSRRFGVANFKYGARDLYEQIMKAIS